MGKVLPFNVGVPSGKSLIDPKLAGATPVTVTPLIFVWKGAGMFERSIKLPF